MISLQELALADAGRQLRIAYCIQQAIINSGFKVYFQPIVSSETGESSRRKPSCACTTASSAG